MAGPANIPDTEAAKSRGYHHGDLKRALTTAALQLVQEKGPNGFTLREVARRAGVSTAAPYRHFADKAQLLAAAAAQGFVQLHEALDAVTATDLSEQVLAMGRAYVRWAIAHPDYYQVMFGPELDNTDSPEVREAGERGFTDLLDAIVRCQAAGLLPAGDPKDLAGPIWSLLHGVSTLTIGRHLSNVGIREDAEALTERALRQMLI
ncbi:TetR/AcrR family transcriptional regulator [Mycobacterium barrassiae]|uniref:TetR/AcrR family transcriptional regulator n=1 Tax=Mycobacterium barrassiae TaxID=319709 RepID=UPI002265DC76|nr:TetR/AcrR family transcriptional regulator [Mycobacterium barrassiae]MCV7298291.1 TetR/AcrR family transcriptional regulator [Mycobacterium barrassiae]